MLSMYVYKTHYVLAAANLRARREKSKFFLLFRGAADIVVNDQGAFSARVCLLLHP